MDEALTDLTGSMSLRSDSYDSVRETFRWDVPERFNIGVDVTDKWAATDPDRVAIIDGNKGLNASFGELSQESNRLANVLVSKGLQKGDRVAVLAPQRIETAIAHAAIFKAGAISVPLFSLFGHEALTHRLQDSAARFVIADTAGMAKLAEMQGALPALEHVIDMDGAGWDELTQASDSFDPVETKSDDPALIIYTSGTTGSSKGALHAHRVLLGHLPGVEMSHGGLPKPGDCLWTPADWAWIGGLLDVLLPALHYGLPVVAKRFEKFDPEQALQLMQDCKVTATFLPPTALRMLRQVDRPGERWNLSLRSIASGGESLGEELPRWAQQEFGIGINEFYGQTECNMIVSACDAWFANCPGAMGKPTPGHDVRIVDDEGHELALGEEGHIAVGAPDPVMFLHYWNNPDATAEKFAGDMLITGDRGYADGDGFIHFVGRADDVITSAGYRIGPAEIEDCLLRHPAVSAVGVVGVPDALRTEVVTAFVVLRAGVEGKLELARELQEHVRSRLEWPPVSARGAFH
ncbi:MAG: AMP-binding protein [Novosphingobium sp.]